MTDPDRGTGRTTKQLREAPRGALFIWCNGNLAYARSMAANLGRSDIDIRGPDVFDAHGSLQLRGRFWPKVIIDHAAQLSCEQWARYSELLPFIERGPTTGSELREAYLSERSERGDSAARG